MPVVPAHTRLKDYEFQVYLGYIDRSYFKKGFNTLESLRSEKAP